MEQASIPTPSTKELFIIVRNKPQTGPCFGLSHRKKRFYPIFWQEAFFIKFRYSRKIRKVFKRKLEKEAPFQKLDLKLYNPFQINSVKSNKKSTKREK